MHQSVFDGSFEHHPQLGVPFRRPSQGSIDGCIEFLTQPPIIALDFLPLRPVGRLVRGQTTLHRIDSEGKQLIESWMKRLQAKDSMCQQIPIEGFDVSKVKNYAMTFGNRPLVHGLVKDDAK
jgi:hypothetical protein